MHSQELRHHRLDRHLVYAVPPSFLTRVGLVCTIAFGYWAVSVHRAIAYSISFTDFELALAQTPSPESKSADLFFLRTSPQSHNNPNRLEDDTESNDSATGNLVLQTEGILEDGDHVAFQDGSFYDEYPVEGISGQRLRISLESSDFDPYLIVIGPSGDILAHHDDIAPDNLNATLDIVLPDDGVYRVIANGYDHFSQGRYTLSIHSSSPGGENLPLSPRLPAQED